MSASRFLMTVEFEPAILKWMERYCFESDIPFSQALNQVLELGQHCIENDTAPEALSKPQKLLIQCAMESLLILQDSISPEQRKAIGEKAKILIRNTLNLAATTECQPS